MAWRYCRDRGRAEEMAQEAFLRAWRGLVPMAPRKQLFHLAFRARRQCFPLRTQAVPHRQPYHSTKSPEPSVRPAQYSKLLQRERDEMVRRAVLALPLRYREPVILYYFYEMDVAAAACTLGLPEGTLKARLSRARGSPLKNRFPHLNGAEPQAPKSPHSIQEGRPQNEPGSRQTNWSSILARSSVVSSAFWLPRRTLVPSSGFLASVMGSVEAEARMPAPIPFPWKRAIPGILLAVGVFGWGAFAFIREAIRGTRERCTFPAAPFPRGRTAS